VTCLLPLPPRDTNGLTTRPSMHGALPKTASVIVSAVNETKVKVHLAGEEQQMKQWILGGLVAVGLVTCVLGCSADETQDGGPAKYGVVSIDDLGVLQLGMSDQDVADLLGKPARYLGSGLLSAWYDLDDGGSAFVDYTFDAKLWRVRVQDSAGNERVLLEGER
jgi:hypothetical protein